jgi:hypothetical protein
MHKEMKSGVRKILIMKGRRKDVREIWVEPGKKMSANTGLKDTFKRLTKMREILA